MLGVARAHPVFPRVLAVGAGKSSLLNALTGSERACVGPIAGTTIDDVDSLVAGPAEYPSLPLVRLVDTAGIR